MASAENVPFTSGKNGPRESRFKAEVPKNTHRCFGSNVETLLAVSYFANFEVQTEALSQSWARDQKRRESAFAPPLDNANFL